MPALRVMTVLPPREHFAEAEAGAIAILVHRMARPGESVVGRALLGAPYADVPFLAVPRVFLPLRRQARYAAGVARLVRQVRPDLVEVHNRADLALALRRWCPGVPIMLVLHNDPCGMRGASTPAERTLLARQVAVVAVSEWLRLRFVSGGVQACVSVLPNSLDYTQLPPPATRENLVLFAGRVVADKGADAFVAACRTLLPRYPRWRAEILGADRFGPHSPETGFLRQLRADAALAGVSLRGVVPHAQVLQAMSRAALVVVPSRWAEPFGMVALEAMGCGAALVVSRNGNLPDLAGPAALYADPDSLPTLTGAMEQLMNDAGLRASLGAAGRRRAACFDSRAIAVQREHLHAEIVRAWPGKGLFQA
ncbi:glycosyltransferase family 4 protein [Acetobacter sp. TBRC 12305]|uniref:Glycosyltransferase family 4 protein n=1 Tax=Acetobacter garciniae TaxID=2817435 RepID=A0A939HMY9_9PROT|nr:glycosyltransferase family 4 protein [Acetobacter garciniae]MBO1324352.1 glycosyltransferase family 4 protein [Acetobacter garciniae]MBX0344041.1 glycosyltransferase family 4 protein [Acetobacter garciniae]